MKSSPLLLKPHYVSQFNLSHHAEYQASVANRVREYFYLRWPCAEVKKEMFLNYDTDLFTMHTCPGAPEDRAELAAKFSLYITFFDDLLEHLPHDEAMQVAKGSRKVFLDGHPPQNTLESIWHDICSEILSKGDPHSCEIAKSMFGHTVKWVEAVVKHFNQPKAEVKGLDEYLKFRFEDIGFRMTMELIAWQVDLGAPPEHILSDPDYDLLWSLAADQMILINDMFSYRREAILEEQKGFHVFNAIRLLLREDGVDETNVMDTLAAHTQSREASFVATANRLRGRYKDGTEDLEVIERWVAFFIDSMAGNNYWSANCGRYNDMLDDSLFNHE